VPMCFLVAGTGGFVGRHVVKAIREGSPGSRLIGIGPPPGTDDSLSVRMDAGSFPLVRDFVGAQRPDVVINCIGSLGADHALSLQGNFCTVRMLIRAVSATRSGVRYVQLGSAAEYTPLPRPQQTREDSPADPPSRYGRSKLMATNAVLAASERGRLSAVVLRLFNPIGPGMRGETLAGRLSQFLSAGSGVDAKLLVGRLDAFRDYVDVRDAARAIVCAATSLDSLSGEIINIAQGQALITRDLVRSLLELHQGQPQVVEQEEGGSSRSGDAPWQEADVRKARKLLNWHAATPWPDTLRYVLSS